MSGISSIIEWGFEEVHWELQQQTKILRSIDHTLKTPNQTQANELRIMAEELRKRGVFDKSIDRFSKALELNPLDYRIYIGKAFTYLDINQPDKARQLLESSLPHAPNALSSLGNGEIISKDDDEFDDFDSEMLKVLQEEKKPKVEEIIDRLHNKYNDGEKGEKQDFDFRSYSHRLIGRTYFCEENYAKAVEALKKSVEISPSYDLGLYDLSQYNALLQQEKECIAFLEKAISVNPFCFQLAQAESNFNLLKSSVLACLDRRREKVFNVTEDVMREFENIIRIADKEISLRKQEPWGSESSESITLYDNACSLLTESKQKIVSKNYMELLDAEIIGRKGKLLAAKIPGIVKREMRIIQQNRAKVRSDIWKKLPSRILGYSVLGAFVLGLPIGAPVASQFQWGYPGIGFLALLGALIGSSIAILQTWKEVEVGVK